MDTGRDISPGSGLTWPLCAPSARDRPARTKGWPTLSGATLPESFLATIASLSLIRGNGRGKRDFLLPSTPKGRGDYPQRTRDTLDGLVISQNPVGVFDAMDDSTDGVK